MRETRRLSRAANTARFATILVAWHPSRNMREGCRSSHVRNAARTRAAFRRMASKARRRLDSAIIAELGW